MQNDDSFQEEGLDHSAFEESFDLPPIPEKYPEDRYVKFMKRKPTNQYRCYCFDCYKNSCESDFTELNFLRNYFNESLCKSTDCAECPNRNIDNCLFKTSRIQLKYHDFQSETEKPFLLRDCFYTEEDKLRLQYKRELDQKLETEEIVAKKLKRVLPEDEETQDFDASPIIRI